MAPVFLRTSGAETLPAKAKGQLVSARIVPGPGGRVGYRLPVDPSMESRRRTGRDCASSLDVTWRLKLCARCDGERGMRIGSDPRRGGMPSTAATAEIQAPTSWL